MSIVIVGGGQAGGQAAASLRQEGYAGRIVLIGDEPQLPYQRPPLSKQYLAGEFAVANLALRPAAFYAAKNIELRQGARAEGVDLKARTVACSDGETLAYDQLLLATGARPRQLKVEGADLPGVHELRTLADADAIKREFVPGRRIAIVGGGYIGLEVAAVAVQAGLQATVLEMEERLLARVATPALSSFYAGLHASRGVTIRTGARVAGFAGDGRLCAVHCADGSRALADLAVVGVGVLPDTSLAEDAGLRCEDGVAVDECARASAPGVYAAGDCANHPNPLLGRRLRLESVPNAIEQARVAAANMAGNPKRYAAMPWFWSDQYDAKLQILGFPAADDQRVVRGDPEDPASSAFVAFYLKDGALVGAEAVNSPREFMAARRLVGRSVDAERLANPATDLKDLMLEARG